MKRLRNIFRLLFFFVAIVLIVYLNTKTNDNAESVAEFKFKMYQKLATDSLDSKRKVELLVDETARYVKDTSHVKRGLNYLTLLFTMAVIVELAFLISGKVNHGQKPG
jgi:hypothetical protein